MGLPGLMSADEHDSAGRLDPRTSIPGPSRRGPPATLARARSNRSRVTLGEGSLAAPQDPESEETPLVNDPKPDMKQRTVLETLAKSPSDFGECVPQAGGRPLQSTPTQQRTWNQQANQPDSAPDIAQE